MNDDIFLDSYEFANETDDLPPLEPINQDN